MTHPVQPTRRDFLGQATAASTVALAGQALAASGDESAKQRWLPLIADGSLTATLAVAEETGCWDLGDVAATAEAAGHGWVVNGSKFFVVDGHSADLLLVVNNQNSAGALRLHFLRGASSNRCYFRDC